jgi:transposase InsO family protein/transposase-like protein
MRYSQSEKMEIIRLVEESRLSVRQTLAELDISRSTFYNWYKRYCEEGYEGLADKKPCPRKFWNRIPDAVRKQVVDIALDNTEKSPRELAWHITDTQGYFISESSVYRILKSYDLITSPAYILIAASDKFQHPTKRVNEIWQTDFTYFKIVGWGWYYLSSVFDDYSRFLIVNKLCSGMSAEDVMETLDLAIAKTGVDKVKVRHRPRLLSDNGSCYISKELREYLDKREFTHSRGKPYHPMTQGKIERFHRSMKNVINLEHYYLPEELEREIAKFVDYYNYHRYHEALNNLTPADVYFGRKKERLDQRKNIKRNTLLNRKKYNLKTVNPQLSETAISHIN